MIEESEVGKMYPTASASQAVVPASIPHQVSRRNGGTSSHLENEKSKNKNVVTGGKKNIINTGNKNARM